MGTPGGLGTAGGMDAAGREEHSWERGTQLRNMQCRGRLEKVQRRHYEDDTYDDSGGTDGTAGATMKKDARQWTTSHRVVIDKVSHRLIL